MVSITEQADDTPTGKLLEGIIESVDEFYSENLAQEVTRGMREAASRGFWIASRTPYGYNRVMVQDEAKKRPTLEPDPDASQIVKRIFDMKHGKDACETPRLNARRFEELVVGKIRSNVLTDSNIRALVKVVDEQRDSVVAEQRKRLETIEEELEDVKRILGRIWHFIETADNVEMTDASDRIREHRDRQERLEDLERKPGPSSLSAGRSWTTWNPLRPTPRR